MSLALEKWNQSAVLEYYEGYWAKHPAERFNDQDVESRIVEVMAAAYMERYPKHKRELRLPDRDLGGMNFYGYIDGEITEGVIVEDKFKSRWTAADEEALVLDDQMLGYVYSYAQALRVRPSDISVEYRVTKKPQLRQRQGETKDEFITRIAADVAARPDFYFISIPLRFADEQIEEWEKDTVSVASTILFQRERNEFPRNTNACKDFGSLCDYWAICSAKDVIELEAVISDHFVKRVDTPIKGDQ